jgi:hypothetical protein
VPVLSPLRPASTRDQVLLRRLPEGVPEEIIESRADHRQPFPDDRGLRFEDDPDHPLPEGYAERLFPAAPAV